ncbi:MAG: NAD(P)H-dependent oxidoreductase, partial [Sphingomonadaceae bacterium]
AQAAGHSVETIDLAHLPVPPLTSQAAFMKEPVPDGLREAAQAIRDADHLVLIFPLWLGTMPALLKAFLEQVMRPGLAFAHRERGFPEKLMAGKSARIIVTMGMPALLYRWWYGGLGVRGLRRSILQFAGFAPVRTTLLGSVEADKRRREAWLDLMRRLGRAAR